MQLLRCLMTKNVLFSLLILSCNNFVFPQSGESYHTFGFHKFDATVLSPYQMIHVNQENAQFVRSLIQKELESRGLQLSSTPDYLVNVKVILKLHQQILGQETQVRSGHSQNHSISIYQVGILEVELVDEKENAYWKGSRSMPLWKKKEKTIRKRLDNFVAKLFKKFEADALESFSN